MKDVLLYALKKKRFWLAVISLLAAGGLNVAPPLAEPIAGVIAEFFSAAAEQSDEVRGGGER